MKFFKKHQYIIMSILGIITILFFFQIVFENDEKFSERILKIRQEENYSGVVFEKFIDSSDHCIPKIKIEDRIIGLDNFVWDKLCLGDSIVKIKGELIIKVFSVKGEKYILNYNTYFKNEHEGYSTNILPRQQGLLNDFENVFTKAQQNELSKFLLNFNRQTKNKIIIASVASFIPYEDFQQFTISLGNKWKIEQNNNGKTILIVFSKKNGKFGLAMARNVEGLTDVEAQKVISDVFVPLFKDEKYYEGTKQGILKLISIWDN